MSARPRPSARQRRAAHRRAEIRKAWLSITGSSPFLRTPTAKEIARRLDFQISFQAIRWHMRAITAAAERARPGVVDTGKVSSAEPAAVNSDEP